MGTVYVATLQGAGPGVCALNVHISCSILAETHFECPGQSNWLICPCIGCGERAKRLDNREQA